MYLKKTPADSERKTVEMVDRHSKRGREREREREKRRIRRGRRAGEIKYDFSMRAE